MSKGKLVRVFLLLVLMISLVLTLNYFWQASGKSTPNPSLSLLDSLEKYGAPDFEVKTLEDKKISLSQFKGKIVLLNFWATWCGPCVDEIPSFIRLAEKLSEDLVLILISEDSDLPEINTFLKSFPKVRQSNIYIVWDSDRKLMKLYGSERLPETYILKPDHKLAKKVIGSIDWATPDALDYLKSLKQ